MLYHDKLRKQALSQVPGKFNRNLTKFLLEYNIRLYIYSGFAYIRQKSIMLGLNFLQEKNIELHK